MREQIAFRVDAGEAIGLGHIKRCIVLAKMMKDAHDVFFLSNKMGLEMAASEGFEGMKTTGAAHEIVGLISRYNLSRIIIDVKEDISLEYIQHLNKAGVKTVLLDNIGEGRLEADVVIFPVVHIQPDILRNIRGRLFHGWDYVIVDRAFSGKRGQKEHVPRILVTMGGSDPNNLTPRIIESLKSIKQIFQCNVIIGPCFKKEVKIDDHRFKAHKGVNSVAGFMLNSDFGIILFGVSAYEAVAARLPSILISDKRNLEYAKQFSEFGTCTFLGESGKLKPKVLTEAIQGLINDGCEVMERKLSTIRVGNKIIEAILT